MPRVKAAHKTARREQILAAAYECFARKGFQRTTMREICDRAKLSPGAVYLYFKGKQAIVEALAREHDARRMAVLAPEQPDAGTAEAVLGFLGRLAQGGPDPMTDGGRAAARGSEMDIRLWAESLDSTALRRIVRRSWSQLVDGLETLFERGRERGDVPPEVSPRGLAQVVVAIMTGLELHVAFDAGLKPDAYFQAVAFVLTRSVGGHVSEEL